MNRQSELLYAAALCLIVSGIGSSHVAFTYREVAQDVQKPARIKDLTKLNDTKVTMNLADTPIRKALNDLLNEININYCVISDATAGSTVTFSVKDVPFEGALVSILRGSRRSNLTYSTLTDILVIIPQQFGPPMPGGVEDEGAGNLRVKMKLENADIRYVIKILIGSVRANYTLDQRVMGNISISCDSIPYSEALDKVLKANKVPLKMSKEDNVYRIEPM